MRVIQEKKDRGRWDVGWGIGVKSCYKIVDAGGKTEDCIELLIVQ